MALASSLQKTASKLVSKFGGAATIRRITVGDYDPATGTAAETTETPQCVAYWRT